MYDVLEKIEDSNSLQAMLHVDEMVNYLKLKNVKFEIISELDAEKYLKENNNLYNVKTYKNNFLIYPSPAEEKEGKYIDLDFAYLKDLSIIDYRVRMLLFKMIIDIEHYLKMKILNMVENINQEDGYRIVNMYLERDFNSLENSKRVHKNIMKKIGNDQYKQLFNELSIDIDSDEKLQNIPIWVFLEIITFGELVDFYKFFCMEYQLKGISDYFILKEIVKLRNAVAHNSCILSDLRKKNNPYKCEQKITYFLNDCNIGRDERKFKISNPRIRQITYTLYMFNKIVSSKGIKENVSIELNDLFFNRICYHKEYYKNNFLIKSVYKYFEKIIGKNYQ